MNKSIPMILLLLVVAVTFTSASTTTEVKFTRYCSNWYTVGLVPADGENPAFEVQARTCRVETPVTVEHGIYPWNWFTVEIVVTTEYEYRHIIGV